MPFQRSSKADLGAMTGASAMAVVMGGGVGVFD